MKKEIKSKGFIALYIVVAVVLGLLTLVSVANMTGNATLWGTLFGSGPTISLNVTNQTNCTDSDGGKDYFRFGITKNSKTTFSDYCVIDNQLKEGYCDVNGEVKVDLYKCPFGYVCQGGACKINQSNQSQNQTRNQISIQRVTYQGVLDMLNKCNVMTYLYGENSTNTTMTCNAVCKQIGQVCVAAYQYQNDMGIKRALPTQCNWNSGTKHLMCTCCSAPSIYAEADDVWDECYGWCMGLRKYSPESCRAYCSNEAIA